MAFNKVKCEQCGKRFLRRVGQLRCPRIFCSLQCSGASRRLHKTKAQKVEEKRLYDISYRAKDGGDWYRAKRRESYRRNHDPVREAAYRKKRMHLHVAYCQQPEYREWKKKYDRQYRCKKFFGPYWEAASTLFDLENEIDTRISRYEIYQQNGTLNKHLNRRREYERLISA